MHPPIDMDRLHADVATLATEFGPRDVTHLANLNRAADWIHDALAGAGGVVEEQRYATHYGPLRNILSRFGPEAGPRLVVGAHYDVCDPLPGADDNASGVAGALAVARALGAEAPRMRVDVVAWTGEEPPLYATAGMGSLVHATRWREENVAVTAVLDLEMIGFFSDAPHSQSYPLFFLHLFYPGRANFIGVVGKFGGGGLVREVKAAMAATGALPVRSMAGPRWLPGIDWSDHRSFWAQGYPAVMITDTSFYRNDGYHEATDTPDTLDYARMAQVVEGVLAALQALGA